MQYAGSIFLVLQCLSGQAEISWYIKTAIFFIFNLAGRRTTSRLFELEARFRINPAVLRTSPSARTSSGG
jgi:hypothetical protein